MWKFLVKNQSIEILEREVLADHQIAYVQFRFTFDGDWKRFHKVVQFSQCDEVYSIILGVDGTSCYLPSELHVGAAKMSVFGYDTASDTTVRATTVPVTLNIRASGFEGEDPPVPPTPDLYAQLLKKIEQAVVGGDGKSAYEIAVEHGYTGTEEEWLASLQGQDGKDGETPDMSEYPKSSEVTTIIEREIAPVAEESHSHDNKDLLDSLSHDLLKELYDLQQFEESTEEDIHELKEDVNNFSNTAHTHENKEALDSTTAPYTTEEKEKLAGLSPGNYATQEALNEQILLLREALAPLEHVSHAHENKDVLDSITEQFMQEQTAFRASTVGTLHGLSTGLSEVGGQAHTHDNKDVLDSITEQFMQEQTAFRASTVGTLHGLSTGLSEVAGQAHTHDNKDVLDTITAAMVTKWGTIDALRSQVITLDSDLSKELAALHAEINALKNGGYTTLFEYGADALSKYGASMGIVMDGGFHTIQHFSQQYPHFCCADNNYALYYGQEDFNWNKPVLTCIEKELHLTSDSKVQICYNSGFTQNGELYLINPPGGKIDVPISTYALNEINHGNAIQLDFEWLQSQNFITTETSCSGISPGVYYLAWIGRSDNTRPIIRSVKVREV